MDKLTLLRCLADIPTGVFCFPAGITIEPVSNYIISVTRIRTCSGIQ